MACCCKGGSRSNKASLSCLGRCDLPRHHCLEREDVKPGPVPKYMGWHYTAKGAPEHQLRCGWRPGHISCQVLRHIEHHNCEREESPPCPHSSKSTKPCCSAKCLDICQPQPCKPAPPPPPPLIRIIRHAGQYTIKTCPSDLITAPSGPHPLKYVLNTDPDNKSEGKYTVEAKFNNYQFDYTSSEASFVIDFSPPEPKVCPKPRKIGCMVCQEKDKDDDDDDDKNKKSKDKEKEKGKENEKQAAQDKDKAKEKEKAKDKAKAK